MQSQGDSQDTGDPSGTAARVSDAFVKTVGREMLRRKIKGKNL